SGVAITAVSRRTTRRHMRRQTPSARQDGNAGTATRLWSRPWRPAGIVAAWCGSFVSVPWWWENRSTSPVVWRGYATTALPSMISMTRLASHSWPSTLRRIRTSGMRISVKNNAWLWSLLDERRRHIEIYTPGLGDLLGDLLGNHGSSQIKPA